MAEEQRYLYHCDRCGSLFKSIRGSAASIRCNTCWEHPARSEFANLEEMPELAQEDIDTKHGIPGKDEADVFIMQKKRRTKQWLAICFLWVVGLAVLAYTANKANEKSNRQTKANAELNEEDEAYLNRKNEALEKCQKRFISFASDTVIHSKLSNLVNGDELVLDINRYYRGNLMKNDLAASSIIRYDLNEEGEKTKFTILYKYQPRGDQNNQGYEFEVLFWKKGGDWLIDWTHFVRLGDMSWFRFTEDQRINTPKRFRLYARELSTESIGLQGYEEYKFSEAYNNSSLPSQIPKSVYVDKQSDMRTMLTDAFRELKEQKRKKTKEPNVIGSFDPPKVIRLDVTVDFQVIEDEKVLVLKEIHNLNWETPPVGDD